MVVFKRLKIIRKTKIRDNTQLLFGISIISNNEPSAFQQGYLVRY